MSFEQCFLKIMDIEGNGILTNDPKDRGQETFSGISRRYWPSWQGWPYIDGMRNHKDFPAVLKHDEVLHQLVSKFYYENFYLPVGGDRLPDLLALEVFEMAVNCGVLPATIILQQALNLLNNDQKYWPDLKVDGKFGNQSFQALATCLARPNRGERVLTSLVNRLQAEHYINLCRHDKSQEAFLVGWLSRT